MIEQRKDVSPEGQGNLPGSVQKFLDALDRRIVGDLAEGMPSRNEAVFARSLRQAITSCELPGDD